MLQGAADFAIQRRRGRAALFQFDVAIDHPAQAVVAGRDWRKGLDYVRVALTSQPGLLPEHFDFVVKTVGIDEQLSGEMTE